MAIAFSYAVAYSVIMVASTSLLVDALPPPVHQIPDFFGTERYTPLVIGLFLIVWGICPCVMDLIQMQQNLPLPTSRVHFLMIYNVCLMRTKCKYNYFFVSNSNSPEWLPGNWSQLRNRWSYRFDRAVSTSVNHYLWLSKLAAHLSCMFDLQTWERYTGICHIR